METQSLTSKKRRWKGNFKRLIIRQTQISQNKPTFKNYLPMNRSRRKPLLQSWWRKLPRQKFSFNNLVSNFIKWDISIVSCMITFHCIKVISVPLVHCFWRFVVFLNMLESSWKSPKTVNCKSYVILPCDSSCFLISWFAVFKIIIGLFCS